MMNQLQQPNPELHFIIGPRYCGKTTLLEKRMRQLQSLNKPFTHINPQELFKTPPKTIEDYKILNEMSTINKKLIKGFLDLFGILPKSSIKTIAHDHIFIDDGQFIKNISTAVLGFLKNGKNVTLVFLDEEDRGGRQLPREIYHLATSFTVLVPKC